MVDVFFPKGVSNTVGSFFSCMPVTASLSRSMIQEAVGGVTQIASIVSCVLLLFILLWIGPFFESLPRVSCRLKFLVLFIFFLLKSVRFSGLLVEFHFILVIKIT